MKVVVTRSGGFTGLSVTWEVQVDAQPDPAAWHALVAELPWNAVADRAPQPDRFIYRIRCDHHEATLTEPDLEGPWREIVERVRQAQSV